MDVARSQLVVMPPREMTKDAAAMLFNEDVPIRSYDDKTPSQLKREYLNQMARDIYRELVPAEKRPKDWQEFTFKYDDADRLGNQIRHLRISLGLPLRSVDTYGVQHSYLGEVEVGLGGKRRSKPGYDSIYRILQALQKAYVTKKTTRPPH